MADEICAKAELDAIWRGLGDLELQIMQSREMIDQSLELLRQLDEFLAKTGQRL